MIERHRDWPTSLPDYRWPKELLRPRYLVLRALLAALFHVSYAIGLALSLLFQRRLCVAVIRTDGIGDAILFEPALEILARTVSPREIHLWAPGSTCDLMRVCPVVRRRIVIPRGFKDGNLLVFRSAAWRARLAFMLGFHRYDMVVHPAESPEPLGNWLFCSMRAHERWINYGDTIHQFEEQRGAAHARATRILENRPGAAHELIRNAYLSTHFGGSLELRNPRLFPTARATAHAERQIFRWRQIEQQVRASGVAIVIPAGSQPINRYPSEKWVEVLRQLWREHRALCALIGGARDESFIESITRQLEDVPYVRPDKTLSLLATVALVGRVDALISVDTGIAHAAVAQDVPSVVLRIGGDPGRFFPWPGENRSIVLYKSMSCEGCRNRCHLPEALCITGIEPEEVVAAYAQLAVERVVVRTTTPAARWMKVAG